MKKILLNTIILANLSFASLNTIEGSLAYTRGDYKKALEIFQKFAEQNDDIAQYNLGQMYYYGHGVKQDYNEALKWFEKAANQNYDAAQFFIGYMYANGLGVEKDYAKAIEFYEKAMLQNNAIAHHSLGYMYANGMGNDISCCYERLEPQYHYSPLQLLLSSWYSHENIP
jgi:TPR repeat protein